MRSVILMYHSITKGEPIDPYGVSRRAFQSQIAWLLDHDYQFVPLATLVQSRKKGVLAKTKQVVLTFDDGYRDFLFNALPTLLRHQLPATVFLVTDMLGQTSIWNSDSPGAPLMTETEVRQIKAQGISVGSHTLVHADLTALNYTALRQQLEASWRALSRFGESYHSLSYPWGKHTDREVAAAKAAGYECAVTVGETINFFGADLYRLGRLVMHRDLRLDSFKRMISDPLWSQRISERFGSLARRVQDWVSPDD
jgi:peptidoglycan/xylan/chitin deacetylase (PgdA/CDA1 family)